MSVTSEQTVSETATEPSVALSGKGLLAAGGILGALAASSCCVIPLVLLSFGLSGAWMGTLTALAPYKAHIVAFTLACLGAGFYLVYRKPRTVGTSGLLCAPIASRGVMKISLWSGVILVLTASSIGSGPFTFVTRVGAPINSDQFPS